MLLTTRVFGNKGLKAFFKQIKTHLETCRPERMLPVPAIFLDVFIEK